MNTYTPAINYISWNWFVTAADEYNQVAIAKQKVAYISKVILKYQTLFDINHNIKDPMFAK